MPNFPVLKKNAPGLNNVTRHIQYEILVKTLLMICWLLGALLVALAILVINILPLKKTVPYLIIQDGEIQEIIELTPSRIKKNQLDSLTESYLRTYIREYMRIDFNTHYARKRLDYIKAFSATSVLQDFAKYSNPKINSDLAKYIEDGIVKEVFVKQITKIEHNVWQATIESRDYALGNPAIKRSKMYSVTVMVDQLGKVDIDSELAQINPLGLIVTQIIIKDYIIDDE